MTPRLVIGGTHSGVGKTTVTLALLAALRMQGRRVQPFKVGPDFIDPGHHLMASGRTSRNLDGWMLSPAVNRDTFLRASADVDLSIIEGMMGLFDGSSPVMDRGSTAEMAKQLAAPVLLVVDGSGVARSAAAMVEGYARFDPDLRVAGVLLNRVAGEGHYRLLKEAIEAVSAVRVVGYFRPDPAVGIEDRHLGLVTALEQQSTDRYERMGKAACDTIDLDLVQTLAREAPPVAGTHPMERSAGHNQTPRVRVGVARDAAFCFYYEDNLDLIEQFGGELKSFSPMTDPVLPDVDLLYLGGGYPELYGEVLSSNGAMRESIRRFAARGGPIYAECGGLMYLTERIRDFEGRAHEMVGIFPAETEMRGAALTIGYREVESSGGSLLSEAGARIRGHEFHRSALVPRGPLTYGFRLFDAKGNPCGCDGLQSGNVLASYTHLHFASRPQTADALVEAGRRYRENHAGLQRTTS